LVSREKKIIALYNLTLMVIQNPFLTYLSGYLTGQVDRVNFVEDISGADIAIEINLRRLTLWPREPLQSSVKGVSMPNSLALVQAIMEQDLPICISLDFDNVREAYWYQEVLLPNVSYVRGVEEAAKEESSLLRQEMDRILDIYRECQALYNSTSGKRQEEMTYYIKLAEQELKTLSDRLEEVNNRMRQLTDV